MGEGFPCRNPDNYDQVGAPPGVVGDAAPWLQANMVVTLSTPEGVPISLELPRTVTFEITDTEPAVKNQTASSSYKPATLENGVRVMVPPFIGVGTKIVVDTYEREYVRRAD